MTESDDKHDAHREPVKLSRFGVDVAPVPGRVAAELWTHIIDADGVNTGYVARRRGRTLAEIATDLHIEFKKHDRYRCLRCNAENVECGPCTKCAAPAIDQYPESLLDEGFSIPFWVTHAGKKAGDIEWPSNVRQVACYAVTGGSEGHWAHVDLAIEQPHRPTPDEMARDANNVAESHSMLSSNLRVGDRWSSIFLPAFADGVRAERARAREFADDGCVISVPIFIAKTFQGMAHAQAIAAKFAELLGA